MKFTIKIDVTRVQKAPASIAYPVQAFDENGIPLFENFRMIPIRRAWLDQIKKSKDADKVDKKSGLTKWQTNLRTVLRGRVTEMIKGMKATAGDQVEDDLAFLEKEL